MKLFFQKTNEGTVHRVGLLPMITAISAAILLLIRAAIALSRIISVLRG
ncbi:MAG: hypothetical protein IJ584_04480 [Bacteroidales bacterium]|nr:hypothetical protein [Bacteroidales bacterium]